MKTEINRLLIVILGFVLLSCSIITKEKHLYKFERQQLLSIEVGIHVPTPIRVQKDNYEEGVIYFYNFADGAYIILFQGAMMEFDIDNYQVQKKEVINNKIISTGVDNNKFWRRDAYKNNIRIYYGNVSTRNKEIYDEILDKVTFNIVGD